ncbi:hypothetical protein CP532_5033, partial [Ophiocordyceps camponoti-leonardi (nom. inval.)]
TSSSCEKHSRSQVPLVGAACTPHLHVSGDCAEVLRRHCASRLKGRLSRLLHLQVEVHAYHVYLTQSILPVWSVILAAKQGPGLLDRYPYKELLRRRRSLSVRLFCRCFCRYTHLPTYAYIPLFTASCRDDFLPPGLNQLDCYSRSCKPPLLRYDLRLDAVSTLTDTGCLWSTALIALSLRLSSLVAEPDVKS